MKLSADVLPVYAFTYRQLEFMRADVKLDNRAVMVRSLALWVVAQKRLEKTTTPPVGLPQNSVSESLAEGYVAAFER